jgi:hypothetical protein
MFLYQVQPNQSAVLLIQVDLGEYVMTYHHMEQNNREIISFSQNRIANNDEINYLQNWIQPLFDQNHVMNLFRDSFWERLNSNDLHFVNVEQA